MKGMPIIPALLLDTDEGLVTSLPDSIYACQAIDNCTHSISISSHASSYKSEGREAKGVNFLTLEG